MNPLNANRPNIMQMLQQVKANPAQFLSQLGIPQNITNPQQAVQWLLERGKVSPAQVQQAQAMIQQNNNK